jgi:hypothetical protein
MVLYPRYPDPYGLRPYEFKDEKERERWIFITIFLVGIPAISLVSFLVYMNTVDYKMSPEIPQFQIDSASVSGVSVTGSQLTATWNITLLATNPNRHLGVDYMTIEASLYYGDKNDVVYWDRKSREVRIVAIATTTSYHPFFLDKGNQTRLVNFKLAVVCQDVGYGLAKEISEGVARRGLVKFGLRIKLWYDYRTKFWTLRGLKDDSFFCNQVEFVFHNHNTTGIFTGQSRVCEGPLVDH